MRCGTAMVAALPLLLSAAVCAASPDEDCSSTVTKTLPESTSKLVAPVSTWSAVNVAEPTGSPGSSRDHGHDDGLNGVLVSSGSGGHGIVSENGNQAGNDSKHGFGSEAEAGNGYGTVWASNLSPGNGVDNGAGNKPGKDTQSGIDSGSGNRGGTNGSDNESDNGVRNELGKSSGSSHSGTVSSNDEESSKGIGSGNIIGGGSENSNGSDSGDKKSGSVSGHGGNPGTGGNGSERGSEDGVRPSHFDGSKSSLSGSGGQFGVSNSDSDSDSSSGVSSHSSSESSGASSSSSSASSADSSSGSNSGSGSGSGSGSTYGRPSTATLPVVTAGASLSRSIATVSSSLVALAGFFML